MRRAGAALAGLCLLGLAACGSPAAASKARGAAVDPIPARDTPLASAPPALAALWRPAGVSLIPGRESMQISQAVVAAGNHTDGTMTDVQVQEIAERSVQENLLTAWAGEHVQPALPARTAADQVILDPTELLLAQGDRLHTPLPCGAYPLELNVMNASPAVEADMAKAAIDVHADPAPFLVEARYPACEYTGTQPDGKAIDVGPGITQPLLYLVAWRDDPLLGRVVFYDGVVLCSGAPSFAAACSAAGAAP